MIIKTRFAPSPTGFLHVGSLRTALYNYLFARKNNGVFLLRIEDTDKARFVDGAIESLISTLGKVGLKYDEGTILKNDGVESLGENGPYIQSQRLDIYHSYADKLIKNGSAYYCFCTKERLETLRRQQEASKQTTKYDRACLRIDDSEIQSRLASGEPRVIRLKIPDGETSFDDVIRGRITIQNCEIDDQVLLKTDGFPTYHLAVVIDDHLMGITHVIRADEWISSVPKSVILYKAFGFTLPVFAHLPLILNPDKSKLSKRQGDVAVEDYLSKGYLPEALVNFVALLGFNPSADKEIYSIDELISSFDLSRVNKGGAVFDINKLNWMNGQYIRKCDPKTLYALAKPFIFQSRGGVDLTDEKAQKILEIEKGRMVKLGDVTERVAMYMQQPEYQTDILIWKKSNRGDALDNLIKLSGFLATLDDSIFDDKSSIEHTIKKYIVDNGFETGNVLWPLRIALSGQESSPNPFEIAWAIGKAETLVRIKLAINKLQT